MKSEITSNICNNKVGTDAEISRKERIFGPIPPFISGNDF